MAPIAIPNPPEDVNGIKGYKEAFNNGPLTYNAKREEDTAKYKNYLPVWEFET